MFIGSVDVQSCTEYDYEIPRCSGTNEKNFTCKVVGVERFNRTTTLNIFTEGKGNV